MPILKNFQNHIENQLPFLKESKLIIAISGGVDSVVLAHLCNSLNYDFVLAHCNFNLRGDESKADENFVLQLAEHLNVEAFIQNFNTQAYADLNKRSIQMAARELRYNWFKELATQLQFNYILTAHHADDNLETFLINFTRGTGLNGLTGIPILNENIARPLLPFSREIIEAYAKANSIVWREDSSNASRKYLRNKLRHEVVPILKEINPNLLDSFKTTLSNLNDTSTIVEDNLNAFSERSIFKKTDNSITYIISEFKNVKNPKAYLFELFKDYGFTQWNDIVNLLDAESGKLVASHTHRLIKHRDYLLLTDLAHSKHNEASFIIEDNNTVKTPIGQFQFEDVEAIDKTSKNIIYVDKEKLKFPLELRLWKEGDYFQPIGMKGKKKISKYLKDEKLSLVEKENIWVLTSNTNIVWVVGKRADERFKVTEETKQIIGIRVN